MAQELREQAANPRFVARVLLQKRKIGVGRALLRHSVDAFSHRLTLFVTLIVPLRW
jgi:hypothetical protein